MKYKVIWIRCRNTHEDREFNSFAKATKYINQAYPNVDFRTTDIQLIGPEKEELVFDYYGKITACIIKLDNSAKDIMEEIRDKIVERRKAVKHLKKEIKDLDKMLQNC